MVASRQAQGALRSKLRRVVERGVTVIPMVASRRRREHCGVSYAEWLSEALQ